MHKFMNYYTNKVPYFNHQKIRMQTINIVGGNNNDNNNSMIIEP